MQCSRTGRLRVFLDPSRKDGHFDGGHNLAAIADRNPLINGTRWVKFKIFTGDLTDEEIRRLAHANNHCKKQQARNEANIDGCFDMFHTALADYEDNISYFDGDEGSYRIETIISMLISATGPFAYKFFTESDARKNSHTKSARSMYRRGVTSKVNYFVKRSQDFAKLCEGKDPILNEFVQLWDYILTDTERLYGASQLRTGSYRRLKIFDSENNPLTKTCKETSFTISGIENSTPIPSQFVMMIISALFRHELRVSRSGQLTWRDDLQEAKERWADNALITMKSLSDRWASHLGTGGDVRTFMEDSDVWDMVSQNLA